MRLTLTTDDGEVIAIIEEIQEYDLNKRSGREALIDEIAGEVWRAIQQGKNVI